MESGREPLHLLQVRPRFILFGAIPILGERDLTEEGGLRGPVGRAFVKNQHERSASRAGMDGLEEPDVPLFINHGLNSSDHVVAFAGLLRASKRVALRRRSGQVCEPAAVGRRLGLAIPIVSK